MQLDLEIQSSTSDFMYLILHDTMNNIPVFGSVYGATAMSLPIVTKTEPFVNIHLAISAEKTSRLNIKEEPCHNVKDNKTLCDCLEVYFQKIEDCILPWHQDMSNMTPLKNDTCVEGNMRNYRKYMDELINKASYGELSKITGCIPSCEQTVSSANRSIILP